MPTAKEVVRFLKRRGFIKKRQKGSHLVLENPNSGDLPKGLFLKILKDAGFNLKNYLEE